MRPIISNDKKRLYARLDYNLVEKTKFSTKTLASATSLPVINPTNFSQNDFVVLSDPGTDRSEVSQISSINGLNIVISTPTTFEYANKTNIYRMEYDQVRFYENDTVINTVSIVPSYLVSVPINSISLDDSTTYSMTFFNTQNSKESPRGERINHADNLLCSPADVAKYESLDILGSKIIDKIDIASREIQNVFRGQDQDIEDVDSPELLRNASALKALRYIFAEISKNPEDIAMKKSKVYDTWYENEFKKMTEIINKEDDNIRVYGQTRCER